MSKARVFLLGSHQVTQLGLALLVNGNLQLDLVGREPAARESVPLVRQAAPDVVIIDMPSADHGMAFALCRELASTCAVVLCPESEDGRVVDRAAQAGALATVAKSDDLTEILRAVHCVQRGRWYVSPALRAEGAVPHLSDRQVQVLKLLADGMAMTDVAAELGVSPETVKTHLRTLERRMGVKGRTEAVAFGIRCGLID